MYKLLNMIGEIVCIRTTYANPRSNMLPDGTKNVTMKEQMGCGLLFPAPRHAPSVCDLSNTVPLKIDFSW